MCGFAACLSLDGKPAAPTVAVMLPTLFARGPDDSGVWQQANLAFGFRRLSIIDLTSGGHQPMVSADGQLCIVFNGEIYNYLEIRDELRRLGHEFRSASDTEVLLHAYQEWGVSCVDHFIGMWAFLIYDHRRRVIFGSRDRFGIKPLFMASAAGQLLMASEIKAIRAGLGARPSINWNVSERFLLHGALDETTDTFFDGIASIAAAHSFTVEVGTGRMTQWCYWKVPTEREPCADAPHRFAELFDESIRLHVRSDVPLAVHLSGGLDSTSILCRMAELRAANSTDELNAICFTDDEFDETEQIQATIARTGAKLHSLSMTPGDIWARLPKMLAAHDEPAHTMTALVSYCLMEVTRQMGIKVVLNGQGADETLAGYSSYFRAFWRELMAAGQYGTLKTNVRTYAEHYGGNARHLIARELKAALKARLASLGPYRAVADFRRRTHHDPWFVRDFVRRFDQPERIPLAMSLHDNLAHSIGRNPLPIYLRIEDRNAMAHSIESRVPFLDHRLVELAFRVESSELLSGHWNKHLLRRAMVNRIPETVRTRWQKLGFPTPAQRWMRGPLAANVHEILTNLLPKSADVLAGKQVLADFEKFRLGKLDCEQKLFRVVEFLLWRHEMAA